MDLHSLPLEIKNILKMTSIYFSNKKEWNIDEYLQKINYFCNQITEIPLTDDLQTIIRNLDLPPNISKPLETDLCYLQDKCKKNNQSQSDNILECIALFSHYFAVISNNLHNDKNLTLQVQLTEEIEQYFFSKDNKKMNGYYVNLLDPKCYDEFEQILNFLKRELLIYDVNLTYCKKILHFIDNEFSKKGILPTQLIFLKQFLNNASDSMILVIAKLYFDSCDIGKKQNCGIKYLQSFLNQEMRKITDDSKKNLLHQILKDAGKMIKEVKLIAPEIELLRNSSIAHYDIQSSENISNISIAINKMEKIYDLSAEILEYLSLKYFERANIFSAEMINLHGFKSFVIQNPWMHNPNPVGKMDLDLFFDTLKKYFYEPSPPK